MSARKFLPDGLSLIDQFDTLSDSERRFVSQIQGRTYANMFGLVERFINAKILEVSRDPLVRRPDQAGGARPLQRRGTQAPELFRRVERLVAEQMPPGYVFLPQPTRSPALCSARAPGPCWR